MHTKQIEYILELAETLNFNKAAENLYISQPTMTYQIRSAEEELGFKIFERSGKGATLTPAGAHQQRFKNSHMARTELLSKIYREYSYCYASTFHDTLSTKGDTRNDVSRFNNYNYPNI